MSRIDDLVQSYRSYISVQNWPTAIPSAKRVLFAIYDPPDERRLRASVTQFQIETEKAGKKWRLIDQTDAFPKWLSNEEYRDRHFAKPESLEMKMRSFQTYLVSQIQTGITADDVDENSVVAILGLASVFGFLRVSDIIREIDNDVRGYLLVFFPGDHENHVYRLLNARDGWNYMAVPITASNKGY